MNDAFGLIKNATDADIRELLRDPKERLLMELYLSELQARKGGKRKTYDTHAFEVNLFENLIRLRDSLWDYYYKPSRGTAHVIFRPVQREIFAAPYVDRVMHHWIVSQLMPWWEERFIYDSYSCRVGKGTSMGIKRLAHYMQSVSDNFIKPAYVVKGDISGYFMHIQRDRLFDRIMWGLDQMFSPEQRDRRYRMLKHAIHEVVFDDPVRGVKIQGSYEDWRGLPEDKSLFAQPAGQGLVIGNLTSQFYSNIYLDGLDHFVTQNLGWKAYGRYVDDFYIVVTEDQLPQVKRDMKAISTYLEGWGMYLNTKKTRIIPVWQGVPFLGAVLKEHRILPDKRMTRNFRQSAIEMVGGFNSIESIVSYLGMLKHYDADRVISKIFHEVGWEYVY